MHKTKGIQHKINIHFTHIEMEIDAARRNDLIIKIYCFEKLQGHKT